MLDVAAIALLLVGALLARRTLSRWEAGLSAAERKALETDLREGRINW